MVLQLAKFYCQRAVERTRNCKSKQSQLAGSVAERTDSYLEDVACVSVDVSRGFELFKRLSTRRRLQDQTDRLGVPQRLDATLGVKIDLNEQDILFLSEC
ncbi:MAG: hypothetical protein J07HN4v3_02551 [Halonotius sp. J07HN4]|nr:MAG: hypothetical protein J07HN4v3_02551 [Halonotius sp. J07HN4]